MHIRCFHFTALPNIALGKEDVHQSTTNSSYVASHDVDGSILTTSMNDDSDTCGFWMVNLGDIYRVEEVHILSSHSGR